MDQQTAAVNVAQKIMAQARPLSRALNDTRNIGHHKGDALIHINDPQVGEEGGKMVVGNLGPGIGCHREQGGLSHVGEAHKAHICQKLQLQNHIPALPRQTHLGKAGHLPGGGGKVFIAPAATAATRQNKVLVPRHVHNDLLRLRVPDHRSPGNLNYQIFSPLPSAAGALSIAAGGRSILPFVPEVHQRGQIVVDPEDHAAAVAAIAPIWAACRHIFLPVKRHRAVAALSGGDGNPDLIYKHRSASLWSISPRGYA